MQRTCSNCFRARKGPKRSLLSASRGAASSTLLNARSSKVFLVTNAHAAHVWSRQAPSPFRMRLLATSLAMGNGSRTGNALIYRHHHPSHHQHLHHRLVRHYGMLRSPSRMTVADLLAVSRQFRTKQTHFIYSDQTLAEAVQYLARNENSGTLVVVDRQKEVVGMLTNHIVLDRIAKMQSMVATSALLEAHQEQSIGSGLLDDLYSGDRNEADQKLLQSLLRAQQEESEGGDDDDSEHLPTKAAWNAKVMEFAIPAKDILYVSPDDSLESCRAIMAVSGRGEIPVLQGHRLLGTVSLIDIASLLYRHETQKAVAPSSAKSDYINLILPRKGLPTNTSLEESSGEDATSTEDEWAYYLRCYAVSIPHPEKTETGGEDAFFLGQVDELLRFKRKKAEMEAQSKLSHNPIAMVANEEIKQIKQNSPVDVLALGVADGVGSWFERGVSAKQFSQDLMQAARDATKISFVRHKKIDPLEVLNAAWHNVLQKETVGSSTACILTIDPQVGELDAVNLGDSGFVIVKDKQTHPERVRKQGTLDASLARKRAEADDSFSALRRSGSQTAGDAQVSYRSPQQLHYFNCPFQLGFAGPDVSSDFSDDVKGNSLKEKPLFETPENGVRLRVPVTEGDLIVLATDGLFDNVDEDVLLEVISKEAKGGVVAMARKLAEKAYELSLDTMQDSPFARLAKENDLMWGGGMPDDITIIVARVMRRH